MGTVKVYKGGQSGVFFNDYNGNCGSSDGDDDDRNADDTIMYYSYVYLMMCIVFLSSASPVASQVPVHVLVMIVMMTLAVMMPPVTMAVVNMVMTQEMIDVDHVIVLRMMVC